MVVIYALDFAQIARIHTHTRAHEYEQKERNKKTTTTSHINGHNQTFYVIKMILKVCRMRTKRSFSASKIYCYGFGYFREIVKWTRETHEMSILLAIGEH